MRLFGRRDHASRRDAAAVWRDWMQANGDGDVGRASALADELTQVAPDSFEAWFEAGLHSKARREWAQCVERNARAMALFGPAEHDEYDGVNPAAWNLGIAATAQGDWSLARRAWTEYGVAGMDQDSSEPINLELGQVPIRLNPDRPTLALQTVPDFGATEVVWCWRRSPAHAVIASVPLPESGHRFRDVLLHDGEPKGTRRYRDQEVPVFDQLERLEKSGLETWQIQVEGASRSDLGALGDLAGSRGLGVDDWSGINLMCSDCSHGSPDSSHEHPPAKPGAQTLGLAGHRGDLERCLDEWVHATGPQVQLYELTWLW